MYIRYNSEIYRFLDKKEYYKIITRNKNKTTDEFYKNKDVYVKKITKTDINIQDIFNVQFFLRWDSHFEKVNTLWEVFADKSYLKDDQVLIRFANGLLPGWRAEEQTVCSRYVDINKCEDFTVLYTYVYKDGIKLEKPSVEEKRVSAKEFKEKMIKYGKSNI